MAKSYSSREIIRMLTADGWNLVRTRGSHQQYTHSDKPGRVTLTHPVRDIPTGTLRELYKQAGWNWPPE